MANCIRDLPQGVGHIGGTDYIDDGGHRDIGGKDGVIQKDFGIIEGVLEI